MKFRKRPIEVNAAPVKELVAAAKSNWRALPDWVVESYDAGNIIFLPRGLSVATLEGSRVALIDDWLIQGVQGEVYPCKSDLFEATYEAVSKEDK